MRITRPTVGSLAVMRRKWFDPAQESFLKRTPCYQGKTARCWGPGRVPVELRRQTLAKPTPEGERPPEGQLRLGGMRRLEGGLARARAHPPRQPRPASPSLKMRRRDGIPTVVLLQTGKPLAEAPGAVSPSLKLCRRREGLLLIVRGRPF